MMTGIPFEEPEKTEMRSRCEVAIDQAGYTLVAHAVALGLPAESGLKGSIKGDLQSVDNNGNRICYYLRPRAIAALPKWLANLATAAHNMPSVKLYVVVGDDPAPEFERSCKSAGAGLLALGSDDSLRLLLDFDQTMPADIEAAFAAELTRLRREMETKLELNLGALQSRLQQVNELTAGMAPDRAELYKEGVDKQYGLWTQWSEDISRRLDEALTTRNADALKPLQEAIAAGPLLDADV